MATTKPQRELSKQALKKLESMSEYEKVRLLALLQIKKTNSQINGMLNVRPFVFYDGLRAEIVHHLFDENDYNARENIPLSREEYFENERKTINYKILVNLFKQQQDIYTRMDAYTAIAYALYYYKFVELAEKADNIEKLRAAKREAYHKVRDVANLFKLNFDFVEADNQKTTSLLAADYRVALEKYLRKEFNLGYKPDAINEFLEKHFAEYEEFDFDEEEFDREPQREYDIYANNVEEYRDDKGNVYYLDPDGHVYYPEEVGDYNDGTTVVKATEDGFLSEDIEK